MYIILEVKNNNLSEDEIIRLKTLVKETITNEGHECESHDSLDYVFIRDEVQFHSDNYKNYNYKRKLSEDEIDNITDILYEDEYLFQDILNSITDEINKAMGISNEFYD